VYSRTVDSHDTDEVDADPLVSFDTGFYGSYFPAVTVHPNWRGPVCFGRPDGQNVPSPPTTRSIS